MQHLFFLVKE